MKIILMVMVKIRRMKMTDLHDFVFNTMRLSRLSNGNLKTYFWWFRQKNFNLNKFDFYHHDLGEFWWLSSWSWWMCVTNQDFGEWVSQIMTLVSACYKRRESLKAEVVEVLGNSLQSPPHPQTWTWSQSVMAKAGWL